MNVRSVAFIAQVLILASIACQAQDLPQPKWQANIAPQEGMTLDDLLLTVPGAKVLESRPGLCRVEINAQELQMLRFAGARLEIVQSPPHPRPTRTMAGTVIAGTPNSLVQEMVDGVSRDSLTSYIGSLQAFGTRYEYTPQRDSAADYIIRTLRNCGVDAQSDWYAFGTTTVYDLEIVSHDSMWAVGSGSMIVATTDAGESWHPQTSPAAGTFYGVEFKGGSSGWVVGSSGGIIHTTDAGATWVQQPSPMTGVLYDVSFANALLGIAVGSGGAVLRTSNGGTNWALIDAGTTSNLRRVEMFDTLNVWAVGAVGTIVHSSDGGMHWVPQASGTASEFCGVDFVSPMVGWAVGSGPSLFKTTDGGLSWGSLPPPAGCDTYLMDIAFPDPLRGVGLSRTGKVFGSTDGGLSWSALYNHLNLGWGPSLYTIKAKPDGRVICCGSRGTLSLSEDEGASWTNLTGGLPPQYVHQSRNIVATIPGRVHPGRECVLVAHYDSYSGAPYDSAPGANDNASGTSAVMEAARLCRMYDFESTVRLVAVSAEELGMVGSSYYALAASNAKRNIKAAINGDMIGYPVVGDTCRLIIGSYLTQNRLIDSAVAYNARYGIGLTLLLEVDETGASDYGPFAMAGYDALEIAEGTPGEIWGGLDPYYHTFSDMVDKLSPGLIRRGAQLMLATLAELAVPVGRVAAVPPTVSVPENFLLQQNFPNPFNPNTTISFSVAYPQLTTLKVYDLLGREVAGLVSEKKAPGTYHVQFDASRLASGVYISRLISGGNVQSRKMILLK